MSLFKLRSLNKKQWFRGPRQLCSTNSFRTCYDAILMVCMYETRPRDSKQRSTRRIITLHIVEYVYIREKALGLQEKINKKNHSYGGLKMRLHVTLRGLEPACLFCIRVPECVEKASVTVRLSESGKDNNLNISEREQFPSGTASVYVCTGTMITVPVQSIMKLGKRIAWSKFD